MHEIPFDGLRAYAALLGITLLAACVPLFWIRKEGLRGALQKSAIAAALVLPFTLGIAWTLSKNELRIDDKTLTLRAAYFYNYSRNLDDFDLSRAQAGTYQSIPDAQLKWRRNGLGLPGISAGRFSTMRDKLVFTLLTDRDNVLYLPAKTGPALLVSLENPAPVLASLDAASKRRASSTSK
jgi:hypothetical protein